MRWMGESDEEPEDIILDQATQAMRESRPEPGQIAAAAEHVAGRLGISFNESAATQSCDDMWPSCCRLQRARCPGGPRAAGEAAHLREAGACAGSIGIRSGGLVGSEGDDAKAC